MSTPKKLALAAFSFAVTFLLPVLAFAQQEEKAGANVFDVRGYAAMGAGIAIGLGALGGALGQGSRRHPLRLRGEFDAVR